MSPREQSHAHNAQEGSSSEDLMYIHRAPAAYRTRSALLLQLTNLIKHENFGSIFALSG